MCSGGESGFDHGVVLIGPSRCNGNNVRLFVFEEFLIALVAVNGTRPGVGFLETNIVFVRNSDETDAVEAVKDNIQTMTKVSCSGMAEDSRL